MYMLTQVTQAHTFVFFILLTELRQDAPHRLVAVIVVFELLQSGQQRVPAPFGDTNGEHDEKAVEARFFHNHTVLGQKLGHDARWNACVVELAIQIKTRGHDGGLDRIQHIETVSQLAKTVPL